MARVKRGVAAHRRHKRLLAQAKGRRGTRSKLVRPAREALFHALVYAYRDRKSRKRDMRRLWIERINAASRQHGMPYGRFIAGLKAAGVEVDRKMLADLAVREPAAFAAMVDTAKASFTSSRRRLTSASPALLRKRSGVVRFPPMIAGPMDMPDLATRLEQLRDRCARASWPPAPTPPRWKPCATSCCGRSGALTLLLRSLGEAPAEERPAARHGSPTRCAPRSSPRWPRAWRR